MEDQEKAATFYKQTFGMTEAWRGPVRDDGNRAIYLTDGYINMAVLPARGGREGIDHFGFQVEDLDGDVKKRAGLRRAGRGGEETAETAASPRWACTIRWGRLVDVTVHGWKS